jgi:hypothetical protein
MPALLTTPAGGLLQGAADRCLYPHQSPLSLEHSASGHEFGAQPGKQHPTACNCDVAATGWPQMRLVDCAQHCANTTQLLRSRNYVPPRTAFYCDWLKFSDETVAGQFLQTWPRYDLQLQLRKVRAEYDDCALKLERDLSLGHYDPPTSQTALVSRKAIHRGA